MMIERDTADLLRLSAAKTDPAILTLDNATLQMLRPRWSTIARTAARRALLPACLCAGCDAARPPADQAWVRAQGLAPVADSLVVAKGSLLDPGCPADAVRRLVVTSAEWDTVWSAVRGCSPPRLDRTFSFEREGVVFVSGGRWGSGGSSVGIEGLGMRGDTVVVAVVERHKQSGCNTTDMEEHPWEVVRVPPTVRVAAFRTLEMSEPCEVP